MSAHFKARMFNLEQHDKEKLKMHRESIEKQKRLTSRLCEVKSVLQKHQSNLSDLNYRQDSIESPKLRSKKDRNLLQVDKSEFR